MTRPWRRIQDRARLIYASGVSPHAVSSSGSYPGYPPDCPPVTTPLPNSYFRIVRRKERVKRKDFFSPYELGLREDMEITSPCYRRSISIHSTISDSRRIMDLYPGLGRFIAIVKLQGTHGVVQHTPSNEGGQSHHDWWVPASVDPCGFWVPPILGLGE